MSKDALELAGKGKGSVRKIRGTRFLPLADRESRLTQPNPMNHALAFEKDGLLYRLVRADPSGALYQPFGSCQTRERAELLRVRHADERSDSREYQHRDHSIKTPYKRF